MSGEVIVSRDCPWGQLVLRQGIQRSIAVQVLPDGSVSGPADYFAGVQKTFDAVMDRAVPEMVAYLEEREEELGLNGDSSQTVELHQPGHRDCIEATLRTTRKLTAAEKESLTSGLQAIVDVHLQNSA